MSTDSVHNRDSPLLASPLLEGPLLESPLLDWSTDQPVSRRFDDVYFSRENGLAESRYVFIDQNRLTQRWRSLEKGTAATDPETASYSFTIAETGFGTGLNFICAVERWLAEAPKAAVLHYIAVEKFPLQPEELARAHRQWPELDGLSRALRAVYPVCVPGFHRVWLCDAQVCLTLLFGDASIGFEALTGSDHPAFADRGNPAVDAWFLDGFAPAKNPDLWTGQLFHLIGRLSRPGSTFATFTAAGTVKRGLLATGFAVEKVRGFGAKRDMLRGTFTGQAATGDGTSEAPAAVARRHAAGPPWYLPRTESSPSARQATVIGAGIAGCSTARALALRGWRVTLVDSESQPASGASGNPQGIVYPKLSVEPSPLADFNLAALCHATRFYRDMWRDNRLGQRCGVLVLPEKGADESTFRQIARRYRDTPNLVRLATGPELGEIAGIELASASALYFPGLGWLNPPGVCRQLASHPGIRLLTADISSLEQGGGGNCWHLLNRQGETVDTSGTVVIACSNRTRGFQQCSHLPLKPVRGQITSLPDSSGSRALRVVVCGQGYLAPSRDGMHTLGATYNPGDTSLLLSEADHRRNLDSISRTDAKLARAVLANAAGPEDLCTMDGRAALRCTTPDYLPVAGPAPRLDDFLRVFLPLQKNARADIPRCGDYWPGLYLNCGHGSRGLAYAPLAAELIASQIAGEALPLPRHLVQALSPARFIVRGIKRRQFVCG